MREFQQANAISESRPKNIIPELVISSLALWDERAGSEMKNESHDESTSSANKLWFLITDVATEPSRILAKLWK